MRKTAVSAILAAAAMPLMAGSVPERSMLRTEELTSGTYPYRAVKVPVSKGEKLEYEARWMGFPSGKLVLEARWPEKIEDREVMNIRSSITFNSLVSPFYKVNNEAVSILDLQEGFSHHFVLKKNEGRVKYREDVRFDYENMLARYTREEKLSGPHRTRLAVQIPDRTSDPLSFFYYLRSVHLEPGNDTHLTVHTSQRNWNLTVRVLKRMRIKVPRGTFDVFKTEPVASFPGLIERKGRMYLYLEEKTHVPVVMTTDIPIGNISFRLAKSENSPLDAEPGQADDSGLAASQDNTDDLDILDVEDHSKPATNSLAGEAEKR